MPSPDVPEGTRSARRAGSSRSGHRPSIPRTPARLATLLTVGLGLAATLSGMPTGGGPALAVTTGCTTSWSTAAVPRVAEGALSDVAAASPDRAWAVGEYYDGNRRLRSLALTFDGADWQRTPIPNDPSHLDRLEGVAAIGPDDAWAVGVDIVSALPDRTLIARWDGARWTRVPSPNAGPPPDDNGTLFGVAALGADRAWAVGSYRDPAPRPLALHWDGADWTAVPVPVHPAAEASWLSSVSASGPDDLWAVGGYIAAADSSRRPLVMHGDGSSWRVVELPELPGEDLDLLDVVAIAPDDAWAVGVSDDRALRLRWDGETWQRAPGTVTGIASYAGVHAASAVQVWTVGARLETAEPALRSRVERFDGKRWTAMPTPELSEEDRLQAITASGRHQWAVGSFLEDLDPREGTVVSQPLLLHRCGFVDVAGTTHEAGIGAIEAAALVSGHPDGTFRPNSPVTRGQMATMLTAALDLPPGDPTRFSDVPGTTHAAGIGALSAAGIASGHPDGTFRPDTPVTRGQMATMLTAALEL